MNATRKVAAGHIALSVDVMDADTERFVCTLNYQHCPIFKLKMSELMDFIFNKRPTLRYNNIRVIVEKIGADFLWRHKDPSNVILLTDLDYEQETLQYIPATGS